MIISNLALELQGVLPEEEVNEAVAYSIVSVGPRRIEKINIREASRLAMKLSLERVEKKISGKIHVLIDGNTGLETNLPQETIIKGDSKIISIAGASILAKVARDRLMELLEDKMRIWIDSAKFVKPVSGVYVLYNRNKEALYKQETC